MASNQHCAFPCLYLPLITVAAHVEDPKPVNGSFRNRLRASAQMTVRPVSEVSSSTSAALGHDHDGGFRSALRGCPRTRGRGHSLPMIPALACGCQPRFRPTVEPMDTNMPAAATPGEVAVRWDRGASVVAVDSKITPIQIHRHQGPRVCRSDNAS